MSYRGEAYRRKGSAHVEIGLVDSESQHFVVETRLDEKPSFAVPVRDEVLPVFAGGTDRSGGIHVSAFGYQGGNISLQVLAQKAPALPIPLRHATSGAPPRKVAGDEQAVFRHRQLGDRTVLKKSAVHIGPAIPIPPRYASFYAFPIRRVEGRSVRGQGGHLASREEGTQGGPLPVLCRRAFQGGVRFSKGEVASREAQHAQESSRQE